MRKIHKGTTKKAAAFTKSSVSFEITLILDQSPLYLKITQKTNHIPTYKHRILERERERVYIKLIPYPASINPKAKTPVAD